MSKVIGKSFVNDNSGILSEDGYWTVTVLMTETFYYEDGTEKKEVIEVKAMDKDFQTAHQTSLASALVQYRVEVYDRGMGSLVEAREKYGKLTGSVDPNTPTQ